MLVNASFEKINKSVAEVENNPVLPPSTRTLPSGRAVAVCIACFAPMLVVAVNVFVTGSKISADAETVLGASLLQPPTRSTLPSGRRLAV